MGPGRPLIRNVGRIDQRCLSSMRGQQGACRMLRQDILHSTMRILLAFTRRQDVVESRRRSEVPR